MKTVHRSNWNARVPAEKVVTRWEIQLVVTSELDLARARRHTEEIAGKLGFSSLVTVLIAAAGSEVMRNTVKYAGGGKVIIREVEAGSRLGIDITVVDRGPGIPDIDLAMAEGYSTGNSLGQGLPGCRRLMDEFEIRSAAGRGTEVRMTKWTPPSLLKVSSKWSGG